MSLSAWWLLIPRKCIKPLWDKRIYFSLMRLCCSHLHDCLFGLEIVMYQFISKSHELFCQTLTELYKFNFSCYFFYSFLLTIYYSFQEFHLPLWQISIGLVVALNYRNPFMNPYEEFQVIFFFTSLNRGMFKVHIKTFVINYMLLDLYSYFECGGENGRESVVRTGKQTSFFSLSAAF